MENSIERLTRYQSSDRQHRESDTARTVAVAGLANRQNKSRLPHTAWNLVRSYLGIPSFLSRLLSTGKIVRFKRFLKQKRRMEC